MTKVRAAFAFVMVVVMALVIAPEGASGQAASAGQRVAFSRDFTLRTIRINGADDQRVGATPIPASMGVLSPDGTKIAYVSDRLEVVNTNGTGHDFLTPGTDFEQSPTWNMDGSLIGFTRWDDGTNQQQFFTVEPDGDNEQMVTDSTTQSVFSPMFSPTDDRVVFSQRTPADGNRYDLCVMDGDGSNVDCIVESADNFEGPGDWSPNGNSIVYTKYNNEQEQADIFTIRANGTDRVNVTRAPHSDQMDPMWPAGGFILFEHRGTSDTEIHRIRPNEHGIGEAITQNHADEDLQEAT